MKKPCLVKYSKANGRFEAFDESGNIVQYNSMSYHILSMDVEERRYEIVSANSRIGRTILDKINQHTI